MKTLFGKIIVLYLIFAFLIGTLAFAGPCRLASTQAQQTQCGAVLGAFWPATVLIAIQAIIRND